jgi:hypothetical protein
VSTAQTRSGGRDDNLSLGYGRRLSIDVEGIRVSSRGRATGPRYAPSAPPWCGTWGG